METYIETVQENQIHMVHEDGTTYHPIPPFTYGRLRDGVIFLLLPIGESPTRCMQLAID